MDNLTHTLIGVGMAKSGLSKKFGTGTTLILAIASNLPDIDASLFFTSIQDSFLYRRGLTHSVFFIPVIALLASFLFQLRYKNLNLKTIFSLTLLGMAVHVFFDLLNSYGVTVLFPLSLKRYELAWVFIIDLAIWGLLLAPILLSLIPRFRSNPEPVFQVSMVLLTLYVGLCGWGHHNAVKILNRLASEENFEPALVYAFPEALGPHRFRGVLRDQHDTYAMYVIQVWKGDYVFYERYISEESDPLVQKVRATPRLARLERFFKAPVWRVMPAEGDQPATCEVMDLRFVSTVFNRKPLFRFKFSPPN